jgi:hypothetical protein
VKIESGFADASASRRLMAGCISGYVSSHGAVDEERSHILGNGACALRELVPRLRGESAVYVRRLIRITELINEDGRSDFQT